MPLRSFRFENGQFHLEGYPEGATIHGIDGTHADELKRLLLFRGELELVLRWLSIVFAQTSNAPQCGEELAAALCDASLVAFIRCFEYKHPLKPLKPRKLFEASDRDNFERLRVIRNKKVAHDNLLTTGTFALLVQD